jgi:hypothetical protein
MVRDLHSSGTIGLGRLRRSISPHKRRRKQLHSARGKLSLKLNVEVVCLPLTPPLEAVSRQGLTEIKHPNSMLNLNSSRFFAHNANLNVQIRPVRSE